MQRIYNSQEAPVYRPLCVLRLQCILSRLSTAQEPTLLSSQRAPAELVIEAAHKKAILGSTKNGRDSKSKMLDMTIYGDQTTQPGTIIVRQRRTKFHPGKNVGKNVGIGKDYTIFSLIDGLMKFEKFRPDKES